MVYFDPIMHQRVVYITVTWFIVMFAGFVFGRSIVQYYVGFFLVL